MQKARVKLARKEIFLDRSKFFDDNVRDIKDSEICYVFFNDSEVVFFSEKSQFLAKISTDELQHLILDGSVRLMPWERNP